jgi:ribosome-binding protein aMBF1 (putative translation factor)
MKSLGEFLQQMTARDPSFQEGLQEARAELSLGVLLSQLREERGWTQRTLAERAKMPQSAVARFEKAGRTPSVTSLWRLAEAFGVCFVLGPDLSVEAYERRSGPEAVRAGGG